MQNIPVTVLIVTVSSLSPLAVMAEIQHSNESLSFGYLKCYSHPHTAGYHIQSDIRRLFVYKYLNKLFAEDAKHRLIFSVGATACHFAAERLCLLRRINTFFQTWLRVDSSIAGKVKIVQLAI